MESGGDVMRWVDTQLIDLDGEVVGQIVEIFLDGETREPKWAQVAVAERGSERVFVPLSGADDYDGGARVKVTRNQVLTAPEVTAVEGRISPEQEDELERHYAGVGEAGSPATGDAGTETLGRGAVTTTRHDAVEDVPPIVRSEEELVVERRAVPRERVRLVKRVITETVTRTVDVRREELHVERVPLDVGGDEQATSSEDAVPVQEADPSSGAPGRSRLAERLPGPLAEGLTALQRRRAAQGGGLTPNAPPFSDEEVDVTLFQEEVVVTKRVVPRERVRLRRAVVVESSEVHDELRKERVELESAVDEGVPPSS